MAKFTFRKFIEKAKREGIPLTEISYTFGNLNREIRQILEVDSQTLYVMNWVHQKGSFQKTSGFSTDRGFLDKEYSVLLTTVDGKRFLSRGPSMLRGILLVLH